MTPPFYIAYVHLPNANSLTPLEIQASLKFYPFFNGVLGAIDGTHIPCTPSATDWQVTRNHKGTFTQNCLVACSFDLRFTYFLSSWEGFIADFTLFNDACQTDFYIPNGRYYLADAGFASLDTLLVPYRGVQYHLSEWGCSKDTYVIHYFLKFSLMFFQVHAMPRSCSTYVMHWLATSSSRSLGSLSSIFESSSCHQSITWMFRPWFCLHL